MKQTIFKIAKILSIIAGIIVTLVIGAFAVFYIWGINLQNEVYNQSKFDKEIWLQAEKDYNPSADIYNHENNCVRGKMWSDLKKNYLKKGMSLKEVVDLLGPTNKKRVYETKKGERVCLQYYLGECGLITGATALLVICFDIKTSLTNYFALTGRGDSGKEITMR